MRSRLLHLRFWLERKGVLPAGRLALFTAYLFALDVLLFAVQKIGGGVHKGFGGYLTGWVDFLSLVVVVLLALLVARRLSTRMLWRMRNRLIVTYVFIGVVPLLLLVGLAGLAFYLFSGQFATYIVTSRLDSEIDSLRATNQTIAREIADAADRDQISPDFGKSQSNLWRDRQLWVWLDGKLLIDSAQGRNPVAPPSLPTHVPAQFSNIVRDGGRLFVRASATLPSKRGKLTVISSKPLDQGMLLGLSSDLGQISLYGSGLHLQQLDRNTPPPNAPGVSVSAPAGENEKGSRYVLDTGAGPLQPTLSVGEIPAPTRPLDRQVNFATALYVVNWADGDTSQPAGIAVQTRLSKLYDHLFSSLGYFAPAAEVFLFLLAILFAVTELVAWWIGTHITRSVTRAVAQLYQATTHINRGDFSHRIPITSRDQLAALASSFNLMTASIEKLILEQKEKQRLENEITIAQEVQAQLFPQHISQLPTLEVHGFCRPARSVSGDYYDFLPLGSERLVLAVGDVSGKGISAALLMATIHSAVRAYSLEGIPVFRQAQVVGAGPMLATKYDPVIPGAEISPGIMLGLLNHQLYHSTPMEKYATLFLASYDGESRQLTFSNAGHLPPLLLSESGPIRRLEHGGTVVGLFDDLNYDEGSVQLRRGDIFLAYSDGVTEPENEFGEFGERRLIELVQENRDLPLSRIAEIVTAAVDDWIGAAEQPDDVTLVLARAR